MTSTDSAFRDAVFSSQQNEDKQQNNKQRGENGCMEYTDAGVGSDILALSQRVRGGNIADLTDAVLDRGSIQEIVDLVVLCFVTRNTRGGKGEKKLSYDLFLRLWSRFPQTATKLLRLFPLYGYWKDLFLLMELGAELPNSDKLNEACLALVKEQWDKDVAALAVYKGKLAAAEKKAQEDGEGNDHDNAASAVEKIKAAGPRISLLAKWLPREGKALDKKLSGFVKKFAKLVYGDCSAEEHNATAAATPAENAETADGVDADGGANAKEPSSSSSDKTPLWQSRGKKAYRRQVAELTSYLKLPEVLLAAQRADEIDLSRVASKATKLLTPAFLNEDKHGVLRSEDPKRMRLRDMFLDVIVKRGLKGGQVMPHEIVATIRNNGGGISHAMELALDAQWKDMWKQIVEQVKAKAEEENVEFDPTRMVPICDVSGSMSGTPMEVSIAMGIGISEITHEAFQNMVLTFSERPTWHRLNPSDSIVKKVRSLQSADWGMSTDFCAAYDMVLQVCLQHKLRREQMPCLIVFSDMQFNEAAGYCSQNVMFDTIREKVAAAAKKLSWDDPEPSPIVFWNLRNAGNGHPVDKDTPGTVLLSGFSPSLLKLVMTGEAMKEEEIEVVQADGTVKTEKVRVTPEEILRKMLQDPLYDPVRRILGESTEGALQEFEWLEKEEGKSPKPNGDGDGDGDGFEIIDLS